MTKKNLLIELLEDSGKVSLYSPRFEGEEYTEFEKFLLKYKDSYSDEVAQIVYSIQLKVMERQKILTVSGTQLLGPLSFVIETN